MNFEEFVKLKGICKTAGGHKIHDLRATGWNKQYPLIGKIEWENGFLMDMEWNKEGQPRNLPLNHGIHLVAVVPRVELDIVDISKLETRELPKNFVVPVLP